MTGYARGTRREKMTRAALEREGYWCVESRGSHGVADLIALKPGQVLMVQVKTGDLDTNGQLRSGWWNELLEQARTAGALPVVADWPPLNKRGAALRLRVITGWHKPGSPRWAWAPFITDELAEGG